MAPAPVVAKLMVVLAEGDRLMLLSELGAAYHEMLMDRQNVVRAEIVSAEPLAGERVAALEKRLAAVPGKSV